MSYALLTVTREDATSFDAVGTSGEFSIETSESDPPIVVFTGVTWIFLKGAKPAAKTIVSKGAASSSTLLVQNIPGVGGGPSTTRYLLIESAGTGYVSLLDGSNEVDFNPNQYVDVTNSSPPVIGTPQDYNSSTDHSTAAKVQQAQTKYTTLSGQ